MGQEWANPTEEGKLYYRCDRKKGEREKDRKDGKVKEMRGREEKGRTSEER